MVENDYMMRIIHEMVRTIVMLIFHKDQETEEELIFLDGVSQDFYQRLCHLADVGKINEAENMLYPVKNRSRFRDGIPNTFR